MAVSMPGTRLRQSDAVALALSQGFGQATAHSIVFCLGWLPLAMGKGVYYSDRYGTSFQGSSPCSGPSFLQDFGVKFVRQKFYNSKNNHFCAILQ